MGRLIFFVFAATLIWGTALTGYLNADDRPVTNIKQEQNQQAGKEGDVKGLLSEGSGHKASKEGEKKERSKDKSNQDDDDVYKNL